jgi:hypothetical protein
MNQPDRQQEQALIPEAAVMAAVDHVSWGNFAVKRNEVLAILAAAHPALRQETLREVEGALRSERFIQPAAWAVRQSGPLESSRSHAKAALANAADNLATLTQQPQVQADPNLSKDLEVEEEVCQRCGGAGYTCTYEGGFTTIRCEICRGTGKKPAAQAEAFVGSPPCVTCPHNLPDGGRLEARGKPIPTQVDEAESSARPQTAKQLADQQDFDTIRKATEELEALQEDGTGETPEAREKAAMREFMQTVRSSPNPESDEIRATRAALSKLHEAIFPEQYGTDCNPVSTTESKEER